MKETTTIEQVKHDKAGIEKGIQALINDFEMKHDVHVSYLGLTCINNKGRRVNGPVLLSVEV